MVLVSFHLRGPRRPFSCSCIALKPFSRRAFRWGARVGHERQGRVHEHLLPFCPGPLREGVLLPARVLPLPVEPARLNAVAGDEGTQEEEKEEEKGFPSPVVVQNQQRFCSHCLPKVFCDPSESNESEGSRCRRVRPSPSRRGGGDLLSRSYSPLRLLTSPNDACERTQRAQRSSLQHLHAHARPRIASLDHIVTTHRLLPTSFTQRSRAG